MPRKAPFQDLFNQANQPALAVPQGNFLSQLLGGLTGGGSDLQSSLFNLAAIIEKNPDLRSSYLDQAKQAQTQGYYKTLIQQAQTKENRLNAKAALGVADAKQKEQTVKNNTSLIQQRFPGLTESQAAGIATTPALLDIFVKGSTPIKDILNVGSETLQSRIDPLTGQETTATTLSPQGLQEQSQAQSQAQFNAKQTQPQAQKPLTFSNENALRRESVAQNKLAKIIVTNGNTVFKLAENPSNYGDIAIIKTFQKLSDPTTGVLQGEYDVVDQSGALLQKIPALLSKITGGGLLSIAQRKAIVDTVKAMVNEHQKSFDIERSNLVETARRYGMDETKLGANPFDVYQGKAGPSDERTIQFRDLK